MEAWQNLGLGAAMGEDSIYFDQANNHWVGAVSLGYKAGKRVRKTVTGRTETAAGFGRAV